VARGERATTGRRKSGDHSLMKPERRWQWERTYAGEEGDDGGAGSSTMSPMCTTRGYAWIAAVTMGMVEGGRGWQRTGGRGREAGEVYITLLIVSRDTYI
jgi:hypothetical protein